MKLVFLGTSAALPTGRRGLSCVCLDLGREILMFDAGEGAQMSYMRSSLGWNKSMKIFVTHMHGDHCVGVLGLLQTMSLQKRTRAVRIYGPDGIDEFIASNVRILGLDPPFPVLVSTVADGDVIGEPGYAVSVCAAEHTVPALSYCFAERERPGRFLRDRAVELGIPEGRLWGRLQRGAEITVGGRTVRPGQVMGPARRGRRVGVSGDTRPTRRLEEFFRGCDYLVFESTFADSLREMAAETRHSTASEAAVLAKNAGVSNLILTHFSARYDNESDLAAEAEKIHGAVTAARDLLEIEIRDV